MVRTTRCSVCEHLREAAQLVNRPIVACGVAWLAIAAALGAQQPPGQATEPADARILALDPRWTLSFDTATAAPSGFDQDLAYVALKSGELLAVALEDGVVKWRVALTTNLAPASGDGLVFAASDTEVIAFEQRTGDVVWRADLGGAVSGTLHWDSGWLFAGTSTDIVGMRAADGQVRWRATLGGAPAVSPSVSEDHLYIALGDGRVVALSLDTGALVWTRALGQQATGLLALHEQLLVGTRANLLHSLSLDRGRVRWSQKAGADVIGAPAADERSIYLVAYDNVLRALNRGNGNIRWTRNLPSRPTGGPIRDANVVLVPFSTQVIGAYLAATGAEAFSIRATGEIAGAPFLREHSRPTATRLVAMSREGTLQGFAPRHEPPLAPLTDLPGIKVGG